MATRKWKKPNGSEIEVNDDEATNKYAESLNWKPVSGKSKKESKVEEADILLKSKED